MNKNKGITLIVLVITIIILLILAGVTIATLTGDNGILGKSSKASEETEKETATEIINLKITEAQIASYAESQKMPSLQYLADSLCEDEEIEYVELTTQKTASIEEAKLKTITVGQAKSIFTKLKQYPYEFEINGALKLASINGIQIAEKDTSYDNLLHKISELESAMNEQTEKMNNLETTITNQANKIAVLESEKRIKLINNPVTISVQNITGWADGNFANIQLTDSIENYKYLEIQLNALTTNNISCGETNLIATEQINKYVNSNNANFGNSSSFWIYGDYDKSAAYCWFKNSKTFHIGGLIHSNTSEVNNFIIQNIYGIK